MTVLILMAAILIKSSSLLKPRLDVQRRDFTINGLLLDPEGQEVLDFVGGLDDLKRNIIRTIGDPHLRFDEDKLRMLRAVRFAARFGYEIDQPNFHRHPRTRRANPSGQP